MANVVAKELSLLGLVIAIIAIVSFMAGASISVVLISASVVTLAGIVRILQRSAHR
jgi:hypothetical protein